MTSNRKLIFLLIFVFIVIAGGTAGYMLIEGWTFTESLYMTAITISTVGFQEAHPLSPAGQTFTVFFIAVSIFTVGYTVTTVISYVFEGQIRTVMKERRMKKMLSMIRDHYIICGFGSVGRETAEEFHLNKIPFVVMERDVELINKELYPDYIFVEGDATEEKDLEHARIGKASGLISCLSDDHQNVFVVLTARQMNREMQIVSRSTDERTIEKLKKAGADRVISPQLIAGKRLAAVILKPAIVDFLDVISGSSDADFQVHAVQIPEKSLLAGTTLRESNIGQHTGAIIIGIMGPDGVARTNSSNRATLSSIVLNSGDELISLGSKEQVAALRNFCTRKS